MNRIIDIYNARSQIYYEITFLHKRFFIFLKICIEVLSPWRTKKVFVPIWNVLKLEGLSLDWTNLSTRQQEDNKMNELNGMKWQIKHFLTASRFQIVELSVRLIVMWSVPFNLNLYDTYLGIAMIYNQVHNNRKKRDWIIYCKSIKGPFSSSSYWFNKMYYSNIGPHVRGLGGKILMYEGGFDYHYSQHLSRVW